MEQIITFEELKIARHALGYPTFHRNHYVAGEGHKNWETLNSMVEKGFMFKHAGLEEAESQVFHVTKELKEQIVY